MVVVPFYLSHFIDEFKNIVLIAGMTFAQVEAQLRLDGCTYCGDQWSINSNVIVDPSRNW
jgi:hypothetical protein